MSGRLSLILLVSLAIAVPDGAAEQVAQSCGVSRPAGRHIRFTKVHVV